MRKLPIIYRKLPSGKFSVWLLNLNIGSIIFSETTKTYFINFINISDEVVECKDKYEVAATAQEKANEFIDSVLKESE